MEDHLKLPWLLQILNISDSTGLLAKMVVNSPTPQFFQLDSTHLVSLPDTRVVGWGSGWESKHGGLLVPPLGLEFLETGALSSPFCIPSIEYGAGQTDAHWCLSDEWMKVTQVHVLMHRMNGHPDGVSYLALRRESLAQTSACEVPKTLWAQLLGNLSFSPYLLSFCNSSGRGGFLTEPNSLIRWVSCRKPTWRAIRRDPLPFRWPRDCRMRGPREGGDPSLLYLPEKGSSYCSGYFLKLGWKRWRVQFTWKKFTLQIVFLLSLKKK